MYIQAQKGTVNLTIPRPPIYPLLDPKCPLFGTLYPCLRVQGRSWQVLLASCQLLPGAVLPAGLFEYQPPGTRGANQRA